MSSANSPKREVVKIHGLKARTDLNGRFASVLNQPPRASDGRIAVRIDTTGECVWIKVSNTAPIDDDDDDDYVDYRTPNFEDGDDDEVVYRSVPIP